MKRKFITQNGKIKRMLFLCMGIMVFAMNTPVKEYNKSDVGSKKSPKISTDSKDSTPVKKSAEKYDDYDISKISADDFYKKFSGTFKPVINNDEELKNHIEAIRIQSEAFTACKNALPELLDKQKNFYSEKHERDQIIDEEIKEEVKKFLDLTPELPIGVLSTVPAEDCIIQEGSYGKVCSTTDENIVVKKLKIRAFEPFGKIQTKKADVQREVAFATMFYLQNPELAPMVYGYVEYNNFYYIYMQKFDMDFLEYMNSKKYIPVNDNVKTTNQDIILENVMKVLNQATEFFEESGEALKKAGITHNDLRNENILLKINSDQSLTFAIGDFGYATFTGLYYRNHRAILLCQDGNDPNAEQDHRMIMDPFLKMAYVFGSQTKGVDDYDPKLHAKIIDYIEKNDEYSLGISLYELYFQHKMWRSVCAQFKSDQKQEMKKFIAYGTQQIQTLRNSEDFKKYLLSFDESFGEAARKKYIEFIQSGLNAFDLFENYEKVDNASNKKPTSDDEKYEQYMINQRVRKYIRKHVAVKWREFVKAYEKI